MYVLVFYVYICICVQLYMYVYVSVCMCIYLYVHIYLCIYVYMYIYVYLYVYMYMTLLVGLTIPHSFHYSLFYDMNLSCYSSLTLWKLMTVLTKALFHYHLLLNDCFFNQLSLIFYGMILVGKWRMHPFHMSFRFSSVYSWGCFFILFKYCAHYSVLSWDSKLYFRPDYLKQSLARSTHVDCFL